MRRTGSGRSSCRESRITELGLAENFWQMGDTGPCGRCSEIHYHRGNDYPCDEERAGRVCRGLDCSCDRFVEIWNNVFMEFDRQADGTLKPLPAPSIDTGMGLERITAVIQGKLSNYDTDLFTPILTAIGERAGLQYRSTLDDPSDVSMRVVADHLRAMTFLIADGVVPSNEWRGYVLRKIMRRAMRHGKKLGFKEPVLYALVDVIVAEMGSAYPELKTNHDSIVRVVRSEEERFDAVLTAGLPRLEESLDRAAATGNVMSGDDAFRLYDSLGVPLDFMEDLASQRNITIDREGYERAMEGQRVKARAGSAFKGKAADMTWSVSREGLERELQSTGDRFEGYESTRVTGTPVLAIFDSEGVERQQLSEGQRGFIALGQSPFYLEAGGQVSDSGTIAGASGEAVVEGLTRFANWPRLHAVRVAKGQISERDVVTAVVDDTVRDATRRNHTATHLLHAALRQVLGTHVKQAGSLVAPDRLRFDFIHFAAIPREQIERIEAIVNEQIYRNTAGPDRGQVNRRSHRVRRDGAVRREIWRPRSGGLDPRHQHGAVWWHARARDRRHRPLPDHGRDRRGGRSAANRGDHWRGRGRPRPARPLNARGRRVDTVDDAGACPRRGSQAAGRGQAACARS